MSRSRRDAFTLIEIAVVVAILGAITAVAAMTIRQPLKKAECELFLEQFRSLDASARERSGRAESIAIRLDLRERRIALVNERTNTQLVAIDIPPSVQIANFHGFRRNTGANQEFVIPYSKFGTTSTFGFSLAVSSKQQQWIVFFGLTGQLETFPSRARFDAVLRVQ